MRKTRNSALRSVLLFAMLIIVVNNGNGQTTMPEVLEKNTFKEQINYIREKTRIYQDYRAIREDMFQKITKNALDSLKEAQSIITRINNLNTSLNNTSDSLKSALESTKAKLNEAIDTKNRISVLGHEFNKTAYNSVMWTIIAGLVAIFVIGYLTFIRNRIVLVSTRKDLKELQEEFETYRQTSRKTREKMSMDHFNEIKKLKGN